MKLSPLLAHYFFSNKQLSLTGIGRFILDESGFIDDDPGRNKSASGTIRFEQDTSIGEDAELVNFIARESGKMKSLASADLDSHMELARQFLNIGKPFTLEGIGTLTKNKTGKLEFVQTTTVSEKSKEYAGDGKDVTSTTEDSFTDYQEMFSPKKPKISASKKIVTWVIVLIGLALAVFGGYLVYTKTTRKTKEPEIKPVAITNPQSDTTTISKPSISSAQPADSSNFYRFVIETAGRFRALQRFSDLKSYGHDIKMETSDSIRFKLFYLLKVNPADTARIRDSIAINYGRGGIASIESN